LLKVAAVLLILILAMVLIVRLELWASCLVSLFFSGTLFFYYGHNMRFLKKPAFWMQIAVLLLFSALFYRGFTPGSFFSPEGWEVGVRIVFRAVVLLAAFAAVSTELKNPLVKNMLFNKGFKNLYQSVDLAFAVFPQLIEAFSSQKHTLLRFTKQVRIMLDLSRSLLAGFSEAERKRPALFIITGKINTGKTTLAQQTIALLQESKMVVRGFLSHSHTDGVGQKSYLLENIFTGEQKELCSEQFLSGAEKTGRFYFSSEAMEWGRNILLEAGLSAPDLVVVDEVGPLELAGKGWANAIGQASGHCSVPQLWVVRESLVGLAMRKWNMGDIRVFDLDETLPEKIAGCILDGWEGKGKTARNGNDNFLNL